MAEPLRIRRRTRTHSARRERWKRTAFRGRLIRFSAIALVVSVLLGLVDSPVGIWQLYVAWGMLSLALALGLASMAGSWLYEYRHELRANFEAEAEMRERLAEEFSNDAERGEYLLDAEQLLEEGDEQGDAAERVESVAFGLAAGMTAPLSVGVMMVIFFTATNFG